MSPLKSTWYRFVTNVLAPFILPVGGGIVLVYVITPWLAESAGLPSLQAWTSLFSEIEILIIGLISAVGVGFEYSELKKDAEENEIYIPALLRWVGRACAFLFLIAFLAYVGHVFLAVLGASPKTAHIVAKEVRTVKPDPTFRSDSTEAEQPKPQRDRPGPKDPWRSVPVQLTALLVCLSMYIHWRVQRLRRNKS